MVISEFRERERGCIYLLERRREREERISRGERVKRRWMM